MEEHTVLYGPIKGKTYSLYEDSLDTTRYYEVVGDLADACLRQYPDAQGLLARIRKASGKKRYLRKVLGLPVDRSLTSFIVNRSQRALSVYTAGVEAHLQDATLRSLRDGTLLTTEEQYHLYMLEVELVNRAFAERFRGCETKLAFLPHCLRDRNKSCRAEARDIDYACKGCSATCSVNRVSALLRAHGIQPYIWMDADLKEVFKGLRMSKVDFGVLGIACIPELVDGMRLCMDVNVPVVGVPLNANRCARWMGRLHETSVDMRVLEGLVRGN